MSLIKDLLSSDVGVLSALTLLGILVMAAYMYVWVRRKMREDGRSR